MNEFAELLLHPFVTVLDSAHSIVNALIPRLGEITNVGCELRKETFEGQAALAEILSGIPCEAQAQDVCNVWLLRK